MLHCVRTISLSHGPKSPFKPADDQLQSAVLMVHQHWHPMTRKSTRVFIASDWLPVGTQDLDRPANLRQMKWRLVSSGCSICESFSSRLLAFVLSTRENCSVSAVFPSFYTGTNTLTFLRGVRILLLIYKPWSTCI